MNKFVAVFLILLLAGCNCGSPMVVKSIQKADKALTCKDIILEINEAEFYRKDAMKSKSIGFGEILMPTCWVTGYIDGSSAAKSADERIEYLSNIYDLLECGGSSEQESLAAPPIATIPNIQPQPMMSSPQMQMSPVSQGGAFGASPMMSNPQFSQPPMLKTPEMPSLQQIEQQKNVRDLEPEIKQESVKTGTNDPNLHIHIKNDGSKITHSHPHSGSHNH